MTDESHAAEEEEQCLDGHETGDHLVEQADGPAAEPVLPQGREQDAEQVFSEDHDGTEEAAQDERDREVVGDLRADHPHADEEDPYVSIGGEIQELVTAQQTVYCRGDHLSRLILPSAP